MPASSGVRCFVQLDRVWGLVRPEDCLILLQVALTGRKLRLDDRAERMPMPHSSLQFRRQLRQSGGAGYLTQVLIQFFFEQYPILTDFHSFQQVSRWLLAFHVYGQSRGDGK